MRTIDWQKWCCFPTQFFSAAPSRVCSCREKYQIQVLAISRRTGLVQSKIAHTRLSMGDVLLVQGSQNQIADLQAEDIFDVLGVVTPKSGSTGSPRCLERLREYLPACCLLGALEIIPPACGDAVGGAVRLS